MTLALAADVALTFVPGGTGGGLAVRAGDKASDVVHVYAETQVRKLTNDAKGEKVYSSHIKQRQGAGKGARGKILDSEKKWLEHYKKAHGDKRPQGNQKP